LDQIDCPEPLIWKQRQEWFDELFDVDRRGGGYVLGEHATGLLVDLQAVFCAGAFVSSVIIACAIVDAQMREAELESSFEGGMQAAFAQSTSSSDLEWLRLRRNELVHFKPTRPLAISVDNQWSKRDEHERDAQRAVEIVAVAMFENPWV
jgi:hypothetical protein